MNFTTFMVVQWSSQPNFLISKIIKKEEKGERKQKRSRACQQEEENWWILWFVLLAYPEEWDLSLGCLIKLSSFMLFGTNQFLSFFFFFSRPHLQHAEAPRPGTEPQPQQGQCNLVPARPSGNSWSKPISTPEPQYPLLLHEKIRVSNI